MAGFCEKFALVTMLVDGKKSLVGCLGLLMGTGVCRWHARNDQDGNGRSPRAAALPGVYGLLHDAQLGPAGAPLNQGLRIPLAAA